MQTLIFVSEESPKKIGKGAFIHYCQYPLRCIVLGTRDIQLRTELNLWLLSNYGMA